MSEISEQLIERFLDEERVSLRGGPLVVHDELSLDWLPHTRFAQVVLEDALPHTATLRWSTTERALGDIRAGALATSRSRGGETAFVDLEPVLGARCLLYVSIGRGFAYARTAAAEEVTLDAAEAWLRERLPELEPTDAHEIPVTFWTLGSCGPSSTSRTIEVPPWAEVAANYPTALRERLEPLLAPAWRPSGGGQLLLWHGPPGTGKTHALRALGWEWRDWCSLHYVSDPERFFGSAEYMLDVLLAQAYDDEDEEPCWSLLVLEDTGELLTADAKERAGQGLSRLLNVVDGIIGQGLRVLVLVTTNEPLGALHPAVSRPGRCAALIEFGPFPTDEARDWLVDHGAVEPGGVAATLAELYARLRGASVEERPPLGFGVRS